MRKISKYMLCAAALTLGLSAGAQAQSCKSKVALDSVYQNAAGTNNYEYYVQVRNMTAAPLKLNLRLGNFKDVSLFSPVVPNVSLAPHASQSIRFGRGTSAQINSGTVSLSIDTPTGSKPYVAAMDCR